MKTQPPLLRDSIPAGHVTTAEAAQMLGVSPTNVCWYVRKGLLPGHRIGRRFWMFLRADVKKFVKPKHTGRPRKKS